MAGQPINPIKRNAPTLDVKNIQDVYVRQNFLNLQTYFGENNQFYGFKFFELVFNGAVENQRVTHDLEIAPQDIVVLFSSGGPCEVVFNVGLFSSTEMDITVTGPCRIRFLAGTYWNALALVNVAETDALVHYVGSLVSSTSTNTTPVFSLSTATLGGVTGGFNQSTGLYTPPAGTKFIEILEIVGGGGGGGGSGTAGGAVGSTGGTTFFGDSLVQALGGAGGINLGGGGGVGGICRIFIPAVGFVWTGGGGTSTGSQTGVNQTVNGGAGGNSILGGGAASNTYNAAARAGETNTGGGGAGGGSNNVVGCAAGGGGGAAGGAKNILIETLAASYPFSIGDGGAGGASGTSGIPGAKGGSGCIYIKEYK